jgi:hypothetical protein
MESGLRSGWVQAWGELLAFGASHGLSKPCADAPKPNLVSLKIGYAREAIEHRSGQVDNQICHISAGRSYGLPEIEGHVMHIEAVYNKKRSDIFSRIARYLNIIP